MREMISSQEKTVAQMKAEQEAAIQQLAEDHRDNTAYLHTEIRELTSKMVQREHLSKSLPDQEIIVGFSEIAQLVTNFSRQLTQSTWKSRKDSFQFSEDQLEQFSTQTRILKLELIGNTVWLILFDRIFSTPFNVLGREGKTLYSRWISDFSGKQTHLSRSMIFC